jgi:amidase
VVAKANDPTTGYVSPQKAYALKYTANLALDLDDPQYLALKNQQVPAARAGMQALFAKYKIDAIVYPTSVRPAPLIVPAEPPKPPASTDSVANLANQSGFPDLIVPAGMTKDGLPVTISFFGPAFSEGRLIGYGYDFEQATKALRMPKATPGLASDKIDF